MNNREQRKISKQERARLLHRAYQILGMFEADDEPVETLNDLCPDTSSDATGNTAGFSTEAAEHSR